MSIYDLTENLIGLKIWNVLFFRLSGKRHARPINWRRNSIGKNINKRNFERKP